MSPDLPIPDRWSLTRMISLILLVFGGQVVCIFWFGSSATPLPRSPAVSPVLRLASPKTAEWLALSDPTLFALPHVRGFSGLAWLRMPPPPSHPLEWSEPPYFLPLPSAELGAGFGEFVRTNETFLTPATGPRELPIRLPAVPPLTMPRQQSTWHLEGDLARRTWLNPTPLPGWPNAELLTNTVVALLVDAEGYPVSTTRLGPGSGSPQADQLALDLARAARFQSRVEEGPNRKVDPLRGLVWGSVVFEWHTLPPTSTNSAVKPVIGP
jgi:hypothetical protein